MSKVLFAICAAAILAVAVTGVQRVSLGVGDFEFKRLIPANVLRDQRDRCFAYTLCEYRLPNETWPLKPFCGESKCVALRIKNKEGKEVYKLAEQVNDCGPIIDLEATPECEKVSNDKDIELDFPSCCPQYDCQDGFNLSNIVYHTKAGAKTTKVPTPSAESPRSSS